MSTSLMYHTQDFNTKAIDMKRIKLSSGLSNASMEGFNNKIRWLIRQAYGYHDEEYFHLKIFDLPKMNIKLKL